MPVAEIDLKKARRRLAVAQADLREVTDDGARARLEREIRIAEAWIQAAGG
jgi:predicted  nucleic acid-binding Zn-ribbon protein